MASYRRGEPSLRSFKLPILHAADATCNGSRTPRHIWRGAFPTRMRSCEKTGEARLRIRRSPTLFRPKTRRCDVTSSKRSMSTTILAKSAAGARGLTDLS